MKSISVILDEYRRADFHVRVNLYMMHRELRSDFISIDRADIYNKALRCDQKERHPVEKLYLCHCS